MASDHSQNDSSNNARNREHGPLPFARAPHTHDSPSATYAGVDRVGGLLSGLTDLLDASLSSIDQAQRTLKADAIITASGIAQAEKHLSTAADSLDRMSELVHAAMQGKGLALGSPNLQKSRPVTLGEAIEHAAEVCKPLAAKQGVEIRVNVAPALALQPSGAIYTVALNAIQNAIEAIARRGESHGVVEVELRPDVPPREIALGRDDRVWCVLDVRDDGIGLSNAGDAQRAFNLGFTTKPRGAGVGPSVAKNVVQGMGGTIELKSRAAMRDGDRGCLLRVRFPSVAAPVQYRHSA
jgi:signal transduction histidine kinase